MALQERRNFCLCLRMRFKSTSSAQLHLPIIGVPVVYFQLKKTKSKTTFKQDFTHQCFNLNGLMYKLYVESSL